MEDTSIPVPKMLENEVMLASKAKFFYRNPLEVDSVIEKTSNLIGIEVKSSGRDTKQPVKFKEKSGERAKELLLLTERTEKTDMKGIKIMPIWHYCLTISSRKTTR